jgi:hypothetical protein
MLVHLNVQNARVRDVPSRPIYGVGERSGIRVRSVAPRIAWLLFKGFWWRMKEKYVIRDFHPLVFFYALGILMSVVGFALGVVVAASRIFGGNEITTATIVLVSMLVVSGTQLTLFAMWFDQGGQHDLRWRTCLTRVSAQVDPENTVETRGGPAGARPEALHLQWASAECVEAVHTAVVRPRPVRPDWFDRPPGTERGRATTLGPSVAAKGEAPAHAGATANAGMPSPSARCRRKAASASSTLRSVAAAMASGDPRRERD